MFHFDWLKRHAEWTPDRLAIVEAHTGGEITYAAFNERANRFAHFLSETLGVRRGDRVSILGKNSAAYFEILFGCGKMGAILNTLNWRLAVPELEYILSDCSPRVVLYDVEFADTIDDLRARIPCEAWISIGGAGSAEDRWTYEDALEAGSPDGIAFPRLGYEDTWAILYTSGTTGRPKGAQVTFGNFFYNAVGMGWAIDLTSQDLNLNVLPIFHAGGLGLYAGPIFHTGGTLVLMREFDPGEMLRLIEEWQVTVLLLVPSLYLALAEYPDFDRYDLSSVRSWASGGSPLPPALVHRFAEKGIAIQQGFGMTETGPTVFIISQEDAIRKAGSVGKPVLHTEVRIADADGNDVGAGEVGELLVRGGNVTSGYWNRPEATTEAFDDGWLHTGDAARVDEEGFYYIVDRWKDMFISGGENVYPAEVENVIYQHPAVAEVAVIGVPHPKWQEVGRAIVVARAEHSLTPADVIDYCQGKLARYKIPKSVVLVEEALPRTAAGKVLKRELRERFGEAIGA